MFGMVKKQLDASTKNDIEAIIGENTAVKGEINGSSSIRVDGTVEGSISVTATVIIGENGHVKGDITAPDLVIYGKVDGNATIENCLSICSSGQLIGDVKVGSLKIDDGGLFRGRSEMSEIRRNDPALEG